MAKSKSAVLEQPVFISLDDAKGRATSLDKALTKIKKSFGDTAVIKMSDSANSNIERNSSGVLSVDLITGGGFPKGRVVEIFGPESSGKTTLALHAVAAVQKAGGMVAYIDAENALDVSYARKLNVNVDDLLLSQPDSGEQGLQITDELVGSGAISLIVVDSVAALVPRAEIEGEMGDAHVGLQARLMSQALRKLAGTLNKTNTTIIFINQIREKVGVMFGNPETTPGGRALKFYSTIRLDVRKAEQLKDSSDKEHPVYGNMTKIKVVKNKVFPPFRTAEVQMLYGEGISRTADIFQHAVDLDYIEKSGAWYSYNHEHIGQGVKNGVDWLRQHSDIEQQLYDRVMAHFNLEPNPDKPEAVSSKKSNAQVKYPTK